LGGAGLGGAALAAAGGCLPSGAPAPSRASGTLTLWVNDAHREVWKTTEAEWKAAYPNMAARLETVAVPQGSTADDVILAAAAGGTAADAWVHDVTPSWSQGFVEKKIVLALDEYFARLPHLKRVLPWAQKMVQVNGKKWGLPHEVEYIGVFYNRPLLERLNVRQLPETWTQYQTACGTLKAAGVQPQAQAGLPNYGHMFSLLMAARLGRAGQEEILFKEGRWDAEGPLEVARTVREMQASGILPADVLGAGAPQLPGDFQTGKVGFWFNGTWSLAAFERDRRNVQGYDYGHFPVPPLRSGLKPQLAMGLGGGLHVWAEGRFREAAVAWGENNLYSPPAQRVWIESLTEVPPLPFKAEDFNVAPNVRDVLRLLAQPGDLALNMMPLVSGTFRPFFWETTRELLEAKAGAGEWGARLQQRWEQEKREGKVPRQ
ncbi:MAG TPA: extracellular solute-binding protein, partial [Chloroflexota bacterium]|nr:extracellular solute-binding protein [Chloroflexota bacterium]